MFKFDVEIVDVQTALGPDHIESFYLILVPNKAVFQCITYGKPKTTSC